MKVVLLTPFYRPDNYGGAVKVYESLLRNQDFEAHIICPISSKDYDDQQYFDETNIKLHRCSKIQFSYSSSSYIKRIIEFFSYKKRIKSEIRKLISEIEPDLIINGGVRWFAWMNSGLAKFSPVINYIHGEELSIRPVGLFGRWLFRTQNSSFSNVRLNLCVSSYTANKVKEISPKSITSILTNFVDTDAYYPAKDKIALKNEYNLDNKISLVCVCRLIKRKGVADLIYAIEKIKKRYEKDIVLNVCGSGPELNNLKLLSQQLSLSDSITFHGFTDEKVMLELLQASDIFVMPNKSIEGDLEGFGLVFLEANACGTPVIGGNSGGVIDAIEDGVSGFLVDPGSISDLVDKLNVLITDTENSQAIGNNGLDRARSNFTLKRKRDEFKSVLFKVLDGTDFD